jgi:hypothetical protein
VGANPAEWLALRAGLVPVAAADAWGGMALSAVVVAADLGLDPLPTRLLLDCLRSTGHVTERSGRYRLSRSARRWLDPGLTPAGIRELRTTIMRSSSEPTSATAGHAPTATHSGAPEHLPMTLACSEHTILATTPSSESWMAEACPVQELSMPSAVVMSWIACCSAGLTCFPCSRWAAATLLATVSTKRR